MPLEQPQSIRTIFFDAGFTLLQPQRSTSELCQDICQQMGLHVHLDQIRQAMREAEGFFLRYTNLNRHTWANEQAINEMWISYYVTLLRPFVEEHDERRLFQLATTIVEEYENHTSWQTYSDVLPTLRALKERGYMLGVISDWGISLGPIMRQLRLTHYFDCLIISAAVRQAKPSPALYEMALQRANAIADYTIHIGDTYIQDVLGARAVGITPVLLDRRHKLTESAVDCLLVHSLYELLDLLEVPYHEGEQA